MRFGRNLTTSEILDQALHFRRVERVDHCVFMGMGEPLLNLDAVLGACARLPDLGVTHRRTAISTVGWIPGIERLAECEWPLRLALSVHAADDALRTELMPVNARFPLRDVLEACRAHYARKRRRIFVEYVMLAGVNDRYEQAVALARLLRSQDGGPQMFKVNLIPFNPTGGSLRAGRPGTSTAARVARRSRPSGRRWRSTACRPPCASRAGATSTPPAGSWRRGRPEGAHAERTAAGSHGLPAGAGGLRGLTRSGPRRPHSSIGGAPAPSPRASPARSSRSRSSACSSGLGSHCATSGSSLERAQPEQLQEERRRCGRARRRTASARPPRSGRGRAAWRPASRR